MQYHQKFLPIESVSHASFVCHYYFIVAIRCCYARDTMH